MEIVFVQLSHETGEVTVFEVFRKDSLGEFFTLASRRSVTVVAVAGEENPARAAPPRPQNCLLRHPTAQSPHTMDPPAFL